MSTARRRTTIGSALALLLALLLGVVAAGPAAAGKPQPTPTPLPSPPTTLVLYDSTSEYGWLGELYGTMTANLVSHFGTWTAKPVVEYRAGEMSAYKGVVYIGSTYDEPVPAAFLDDVLAGTKPVLWTYDNIWHLGARPTFTSTYGWTPGYFDLSPITEVRYRGTSLTRHEANAGGVLGSTIVDPAKAQVIAEAVRSDGTTLPWALRSGNLTYVADLPFAYITESDRYLAFADLLFDLLAPTTPTRHRALVRLEDVGPDADPAKLRAAADYLASRGIPFAVAAVTWYRDPHGYYNAGTPEDAKLSETGAVAEAMRYLASKNGTMVMHGYSHQYEDINNPYNSVTGDDFEFFRSHVDDQDYVRLDGPVPLSSTSWTLSRIDAARQEFCKSGLPQPTIFEFPHYAGSPVDYAAVKSRFTTRYERALYYSGQVRGPVDTSRFVGQFFPYVVKDVHGTTVIPENLGDIAPLAQNHHPARFPEHLIDAARRNLAVRDGFASFFWHPFLSLDYLKQTVEGIQALGYTFADPDTLAAPASAPSVKCRKGTGNKDVKGGNNRPRPGA